MPDIPEYKLIFGLHGRTVDYVDALGNFTFVFDIDFDEFRKTGKESKLLLEGGGMPLKDMKVWQCITQPDREHWALMLERVIHYLSTLGYEAKIA